MKRIIKKFLPIIIKFIGTFFSFIVSIIISKNLNSYGIGIYSLANSINTILLIIAKFGLDVALIKYIAIYDKNKEHGNVRTTIFKSIIFSSTIALILIFFTYLFSNFISINIFHKNELASFLNIFNLTLVIMVNLNIFSSYFKGKNKTSLGLFIESVIVQMIFSIFLLINFYIIKNNLVISVAIAYFLATISAFVIIFIPFFNDFKSNLGKKQKNYDYKEILKTAKPLLWVNATNYVMSSTDTIMLGIWCTASEVGKYNIAIKITLLFSMLISALNSMFGPKFAVLFSEKKYKELKENINRIKKICFIFALFLCIILGLLSKYILLLWGEEFQSASNILLISLVGQFFVLSKGPIATLLMMCNCEKDHRNNTIITSILNVILNIFLIKIYGVIGAAISTTICLIIKNLLSVYSYNKKIRDIYLK